VWKPGGVANAETSRITHQTKVRRVKTMVRNRRRRIVQRLYGDTAGSSGLRRTG
jgi:hypothetical protein